jgi:hypothetical protein
VSKGIGEHIRSNVVGYVAVFMAATGIAAGAVHQVPKNTVTSKSIAPGAVESADIADSAITKDKMAGSAVRTDNLVDGAVTAAKMSGSAVRTDNLVDGAVTAAKMSGSAVRTDNLVDGAVTAAKMSGSAVRTDNLVDGAVTAAKMAGGAVGPSALADDAKTTLYSNASDGPIDVAVSTPNVVVGTLNLPAGTYLVTASSSATHNSAASSTRLECAVNAPGAALVDSSKVRLAANTGAEPLIFNKQTLVGPATLASAGAVTYQCVSTANTSISLSGVRLMAVRVTDIVPQ